MRNAIKMFGCGFAQVYGLTETTGAITYLPPEDHDERARRLKSCGKADDRRRAARRRRRTARTSPSGEVGEIVVPRAADHARVLEAARGDARKAIRDGWFHTGDAGYLDEDGYLYIHDRVKDMIISGGENIYPAEVENALFGHPAVADVAVIGVPDEQVGRGGQGGRGATGPGAEVTPRRLIAYARERIARYKAPSSVDFVDALPRNPPARSSSASCASRTGRGQERQVH